MSSVVLTFPTEGGGGNEELDKMKRKEQEKLKNGVSLSQLHHLAAIRLP